MRRPPFFRLWPALLLPLLASCTFAPSMAGFPGFGSAPVSAGQEIDRELAAGDYPQALALLDGERRRGKSEAQLAEEYRAAIDGSLKRAAAAQAENDYRTAGLLYRAVLDNYPTTLPLDQQLKASRPSIALNLQFCAERLMEQGLGAYRSGDLDGAIAAWSQILEFDFGHDPARNALATAVRQRDALRTLEDAPRP